MLSLPDFPWDSLLPYRERASSHPDGLIDLSVGSPVDDTPAVAQQALAAASNAPSYPLTAGSPELILAMTQWWERRRNTGPLDSSQVLPTMGSKEMVGLLPTLLGLGASDTVVIPTIAYPTYAVGAAVVGASVVTEDDPDRWPSSASLVWINSPSNPTGQVLPEDYLVRAIARAREIGAVLASDECYAEMAWEVASSPSLLDRGVTNGDVSGLLALCSLSKQSNLAGYRAGLVAGDPALLSSLLLARKHLGLIMPAPIQGAVAATLAEDRHVQEQRGRYRARRELIFPALRAAGFRIDHSEAGLYAWASRDEECWRSVGWCSERGILVAPGSYYGQAGQHHIRVALTATDAACEAAASRLRA